MDWDNKMRADALNYCKEIGDTVGRYIMAAVKYSHKGKVNKEDFWRNLFLESTSPSKKNDPKSKPQYIIVKRQKGPNPDNVPADPYKQLDAQGYFKYLLHGRNRQFPEGQKEDSKYFFELIGVQQNDHDYRGYLREAIDSRNMYSHNNSANVESFNSEQLGKYIKCYINLLEKLKCLPVKWLSDEGGLDDLTTFWEKEEKERTRRFGSSPIKLNDVAERLFIAFDPEQPMSEAEEKALQQAMDDLRINFSKGMIYDEPDLNDLLRRLRQTEALRSILPQAAKPVETKPAKRKAASFTGRLLPNFSILRDQNGSIKTSVPDVLRELVNNFTILADETIFMTDLGQQFFTNSMFPVLRETKTKLALDQSVVNEIFHQYRRAKGFRDAALRAVPSAEDEDWSKEDTENFETKKRGVKLLRMLRKANALAVHFSPTYETDSYINLLQVISQNPSQRFILLSMDPFVASEVESSGLNNVAAAKLLYNKNTFVYNFSRANYEAMLHVVVSDEEPSPVAANEAGTAPQKAAEAGAESATSAKITPTEPAFALGAADSDSADLKGRPAYYKNNDGEQNNMIVGRLLQEGGEGGIYETSLPGCVAKIYKPKYQKDNERRAKIEYMVSHDPNIEELCWPKAQVFDLKGNWLGYIMRRVNGVDLFSTVYRPGRDNRNLVERGWTRRSLALIAANVAGGFDKMHKQGVMMGDVSPRNIMVSPDLSVSFVDCDSYQFGDYKCPVGTALYVPPEIHSRHIGYDYHRTDKHENYSLAVLLFEIMMLGKPPYASRNGNTTDVIQAIIEGNFPYRLKGSDDDKDNNTRSNLLAPAGYWRHIWSHLTYKVKEGFYQTFKENRRKTAAEWHDIMLEYARQIEKQHSSDELMPTTYKIVMDKDGEDISDMIDLECALCHKKFNRSASLQQYYEERKNDRANFCDVCNTMLDNMAQRSVTLVCDHCKKTFTSNAAQWQKLSIKKKKPLCDDCLQEIKIPATCTKCQNTFYIKKRELDRLRREKQPILCNRCQQRR